MHLPRPPERGEFASKTGNGSTFRMYTIRRAVQSAAVFPKVTIAPAVGELSPNVAPTTYAIGAIATRGRIAITALSRKPSVGRVRHERAAVSLVCSIVDAFFLP